MTATLPHDLYTAAQTRELDRSAIKEHNLSAAKLMTRAGHAAMTILDSYWPHAERINICCGGGNNGGDGYVVATLAQQAGLSVNVYELGTPDKMSAETQQARQTAINSGLRLHRFTGDLVPCDLIVDALFGTGLTRDVSGHYADCIKAINNADADVFALDIPSGLHADTGAVMGCAVSAQHTISFIGLNCGLFTGQGSALTGQVHYHDLGVPKRIFTAVHPTLKRLELDQFTSQLSPRPRTAHKGHFGHVCVMGGDHGYAGAALMAAKASARTGTGLTSIATQPTHTSAMTTSQPELMCHGIHNSQQLQALMTSASTLVLGPGLGQSEWSQVLFQSALLESKPMVVDADGLNWLARFREQRDNWVLTPHPGEAARLLDTDTTTIQADRIQAIKTLQQRYGGVIVLKGAGTLIYDGEHCMAICTAGNPGMASGGMGDVLAGVIGGLVAQHFSLFDAACLGVLTHANAADLAVKAEGERGLLATDLLPYIRRQLNLVDSE